MDVVYEIHLSERSSVDTGLLQSALVHTIQLPNTRLTVMPCVVLELREQDPEL